MGAEAATGADLDDGGVDADAAGRHGQGLGPARHEKGRETTDDETCELHPDSFVLTGTAHWPYPGENRYPNPDSGH
jgi:hypothetical protein